MKKLFSQVLVVTTNIYNILFRFLRFFLFSDYLFIFFNTDPPTQSRPAEYLYREELAYTIVVYIIPISGTGW